MRASPLKECRDGLSCGGSWVHCFAPSEILNALRSHLAGDVSALATIDRFLGEPTSEETRQARATWEELERLYRRLEQLRQQGLSTAEVEQKLVSLKRANRQSRQLQEGEFLNDRYRLIESIGRGGFARVWQAFDRVTKRSVAIKVLHDAQSDEPSRVERFERGARQMQGLDHPHIVRVLDGPSEHNGFHYFVMDFLPHGDLYRAVVEQKISRHAALQAVAQVGSALEYAHQRGLIHRDVKPHNILLDSQWIARLTDFDLVWAADTTGGTQTGFMGTYVYAAPEQAEDAKKVDRRVDIYSLGMTVLFVLYGRALPKEATYQRALFIDH